MKQKTMLIFTILTLINSVCFAIPKDSKWEYVLTRNEIAYNVDMLNVNLLYGNIITFWTLSDDREKNETVLALVSVNASEHLFRFDELYAADSKTKNIKFSSVRPSDWRKIYKNSPMEIMVEYVIQSKLRGATL